MIRACCLLIGLVLVASARPEPPVQESVENLIKKLTDEDFEVRAQAARAIEARGVAALPALRKARQHEDPEVRRRIEEWIPALERAETLAPRRVTLQVTNRPVREVAQLIGKQTGYKIVVGDDERNNRGVTLKLDNLTLWEALDRLGAAGGTVIQEGYGAEQIRLQFMDHIVPFVHREGAFRVVGQGLHLGRSINFATLPVQPDENDERRISESLSFNFTLMSEPRLPLLGAGTVNLTKAIDDKGNVLTLKENDAERFRRVHYWGGHRSNSMTLGAALKAPGRNARSIKELAGSVTVTLLVRQETIELTKDIMAAKEKKFTAGQAHIHVLALTEDKDKGRYELKLDVTPSSDKVTGSAWMNSLYSRFELADAKGNKLQHYGSSMSQNGNLAQIRLTFAGGSVPARLIYHDWTTMDHEIGFQFRELPLP